MKITLTPDNLTKIFERTQDPEHYTKYYGEYVQQMLGDLDYGALAKVAQCFLDARKRDSTIYFIGNGGSASTASHFAQDLSDCAVKANVPGFRSVSLTDNSAFITAIGNDHGFENVFTGQMKNVFRKNDLLVVISASGNSPNVVKATKLAKELGGTCIGMVGFDGGEISKMADHVIHVKSPKGEYGPVEGLHSLLMHMMTSYIYFVLKAAQ